MDMIRGEESVWYHIGFSPVALLTMLSVVIGTVLFICAALPWVCRLIKKNPKIFWQENTIIVVPKFMHRIRSNAGSLILLVLLAAGTLAVFGSTTLSMWYPYQAAKRIIPSAMEYRVTDEEQNENVLNALEETVGQDSFHAYQTTVIHVKASSEQMPEEYNTGIEKGREPGFECISWTDFTALIQDQDTDTKRDKREDDNNGSALTAPADNECILVKYHPDREQSDLNAVYHLEIPEQGTTDVRVSAVTTNNPIGFANSTGTLILSDALYEKLAQSYSSRFTVMSINCPGLIIL